MLVLLVEYIFLDLLLWSIFQSSITHYVKQFFQVLTCFMVTFCGQLSCTAFTPIFSDLWVLPSCIPRRPCSCHMILESSYKLTTDNHPDVLQSTSTNRSGLFDDFCW